MQNKSIVKAVSCAADIFYKELFFKFGIDYDNEILYKMNSCGEISYFTSEELVWKRLTAPLPQDIVRIDREEADYIEYMWKKDSQYK